MRFTPDAAGIFLIGFIVLVAGTYLYVADGSKAFSRVNSRVDGAEDRIAAIEKLLGDVADATAKVTDTCVETRNIVSSFRDDVKSHIDAMDLEIKRLKELGVKVSKTVKVVAEAPLPIIVLPSSHKKQERKK